MPLSCHSPPERNGKLINFLKYLFRKKSPYHNWYDVIKCRFKGHKGVIWYNSNGLEPDMTCIGCGDDLG